MIENIRLVNRKYFYYSFQKCFQIFFSDDNSIHSMGQAQDFRYFYQQATNEFSPVPYTLVYKERFIDFYHEGKIINYNSDNYETRLKCSQD